MDIKDTDGEKSVWLSEEIASEVCKWASYRAQTLTRTGEGKLSSIVWDLELNISAYQYTACNHAYGNIDIWILAYMWLPINNFANPTITFKIKQRIEFVSNYEDIPWKCCIPYSILCDTEQWQSCMEPTS